MNYKLLAAAFAVGATSLGGCASITEGTHQAITVNTNPPGASCVLNRKEGQIATIASTPGDVIIRKTKYDITVVCDKPGYQQATFMDHSGVEGMTFGNAILGGGIGWAIDSSTGSDNKYDSPVNVTLVPVQPAAPADAAAPATKP
jgi:hypothetical protein